MRTRPEYHVTCVCGHQIVTEVKEGVCPKCGREYRLVWPAEGGKA